MSLKKPPEDKALDQETLERDFDPKPAAPSDHRTVVCYNPACPDYRVERRDRRPCGCKKPLVESK